MHEPPHHLHAQFCAGSDDGPLCDVVTLVGADSAFSHGDVSLRFRLEPARGTGDNGDGPPRELDGFHAKPFGRPVADAVPEVRDSAMCPEPLLHIGHLVDSTSKILCLSVGRSTVRRPFSYDASPRSSGPSISAQSSPSRPPTATGRPRVAGHGVNAIVVALVTGIAW
jgi:hypothetical protein